MSYQPSIDDLPVSAQQSNVQTTAGSYTPDINDIPTSNNEQSQYTFHGIPQANNSGVLPNTTSGQLISQLYGAQEAQDWYKNAPKQSTFLGQLPDPNDPRIKQAIMQQGIQTGLGSIGGSGIGNEIGFEKSPLMNPENYNATIEAKQPASVQVNSFLQKLAGNYDENGNLIAEPKTAQDNIADTSRRVFFARNSAANEALQHKNFVMNGDQTNPGQANSNITAPVNFNGQMYSTDQLNQLQAQLRLNSKNIQNNIQMAQSKSDPFNAKAVEIGIQPLQDSLAKHQAAIDQIDTLKNQGLKYLSSDMSGINFGAGPGSIREANLNFTQNPTLSNSDTLYQRLGTRWGDLNEIPRGERSPEQLAEMNNIRQAQSNIKTDQNNFMSKLPPQYQQEWNNYTTKWANNVGIYDDTPVIRKMGRGEYDPAIKQNVPITAGFNPSELKSAFSFEPKATTKIAQDIGPSGQGNILYNELQTAGNMPPEDLASAIVAARQTGGYQNYITPEMRSYADRMQQLSSALDQPSKLSKAAKFLKEEGATYGIGSLIGHPYWALVVKHLAKRAK
jgi:hypothetical protein